jgi:hypothetical protein
MRVTIDVEHGEARVTFPNGKIRAYENVRLFLGRSMRQQGAQDRQEDYSREAPPITITLAKKEVRK